MAGGGYVILVLLVVLGVIIAMIAAFAGNRRMKCKKMTVRDMANPNNPIEKYYARYEKKSDIIYLYANLFQPFKTSMEPPFNIKAYLDSGSFKCLRGATGNPDDRNIVPVRTWPLVGKTGAKEFSSELAAAIANMESFVADCKPFRIGQEVEYTGKHKGKDVTAIKGKIIRIGEEGIVVAHNIPFTDKEGNATSKQVELILDEHSQIANLKSLTGEEAAKKLPITPLENFFSAQWVMHNFGIVPVDDVNAVLESEKSSVAQYNSAVESRRQERMSWAARHGPELLIITFFMVAVIGGILYMNAVNSNISSQIGGIHSGAVVAANATKSAAGGLLKGILPAPT